MNFGLIDGDLSSIVRAISSFEEIDKATLFGSRAKGNYKSGSDINIAIYGQEVNMHIVSKLHLLLEEQSLMPYMFDIVDGTHLGHEGLREHIDRVGQVIYSKNAG